MRLVLLGAGRMGQAVADEASGRGHDVADVLGRAELEGLDTSALAGKLGGADAAIDFTVAGQVGRSVAAAAEAGVRLIVGTTGWSDDADAVLAPARRTGLGLVHGPNFSVGVHVFARIVREAARLIDPVDDYDVYLREEHHRHKVDHPSGTARRLADLLVEGVGRKTSWSAELHDGRAHDPAVLQVGSVRSGEIPGTHVVGLEGPHDAIELRHTARSRAGFAHGAVWAAEWVQGRTGIHTFEDALDQVLGAGEHDRA
ncbi:MAG: 4-hydroxy-tetrahydrodipicolinate reductase [Longimicrobiales bacterium]